MSAFFHSNVTAIDGDLMLLKMLLEPTSVDNQSDRFKAISNAT